MTAPWQQFELQHVWHPYSSLTKPVSPLPVVAAEGVQLTLADGTQLVDAMASWWSVIHGYNHPAINAAASAQLERFAHVMFGGLTHEPAAKLCQTLVEITPAGLDRVFLSDSGSVAVDVAMKMALQYWRETGHPAKQKFVALRGGYHGDTLGAMSLCDPVTGMHHLFGDVLPTQYFVERPNCLPGEACTTGSIAELTELLNKKHSELAALVLEPIVQGAGGMYFYSADYLRQARALCDEYNVLLIADEIATGFGRTGELFACDHADISPDILCIGKAMTGGYLSLAATLCTETVAEGVCNGEAGAMMHGPTFMANPLACEISSASIGLLLEQDWRSRINTLQQQLSAALLPLAAHPKVADARCLGAIGVLEAVNPVDMRKVQELLPELGVWLRPFGKLVYTMPPYICEHHHIEKIAAAMQAVVEHCS